MDEYDDRDNDNEFENERDDYNRSEERDPMIRELQAEILRLRAQLDQLMASVRQRAVEAEEISAKIAELSEAIDRLRAKLKRDDRLLAVAWVVMFASVAFSLYTYFSK